MVESAEPRGVKERPQKRIRTSKKLEPSKTVQQSSSDTRLFAPFRALGLVTNHLPFYLQTRSHKGATDGPRIHLLTCLGKSWALWEGGKMSLLFVGEYISKSVEFSEGLRCAGPEELDPISSLIMEGDAIWASSGIHVVKYLRGKEVYIFFYTCNF